MFGNNNAYDENHADELHRYTKALITGDTQPTQAADSELAALQKLALRLDASMKPTTPRPDFVSELRERLHEHHTELYPADERVVRAKKAFGKAVNVFAATAVISHLIGAIVVVITFIIERGRRNRQAAAA